MAALILLSYTKADRVERNDGQAAGPGLSISRSSMSRVKLEFLSTSLNIVLEKV